MKKKLFVLASLFLAFSFVLTGCSPKAPTTDAPKILRTNNSSEPGSLDPALAQGTHESWVLQHTFEGLMSYAEDGSIVPGAAESYTLADDKVTYTFKLRDGMKWSNGDPVTANDFEFAWKRALAPETAADYAYQLYYLKGGEAYNSGAGTADEVGVKALDDKTLEVVLETSIPTIQ